MSLNGMVKNRIDEINLVVVHYFLGAYSNLVP